MNYYLQPTEGLMTEIIQQHINMCSENGGGKIFFNKGTYLTVPGNSEYELKDVPHLIGTRAEVCIPLTNEKRSGH